MRITFILPYAGLLGGLRVVAIYAERLKARGHEVNIVSVPGPRKSLKQKVRSFIKGRGWPSDNGVGPTYFDGLDIRHDILDRHRAVTDGDVPDADVVVATWWETASWVAALGASKGAKVYFVQDYGANPGQPMERVAETWKLPLHKLSISKWLMSLIEEHCGDRDVTYVPNSVDLKLFSAPPRGKQPTPTIGLMYSTRPQKGLDLMLAALQMVRRRVPGLHVVAYGPSAPTRAFPLPDDATFYHRPADDTLASIYASCDAWLFGSRLEGYGLPITEAMACRTPVIATPAGAAPELLEPGGGVLLNDYEPGAMAAAIERIAALSDEQWRHMSDAAYRTVTGYTWDDATDRFEAGLRRAVEKSTGRHASATETS